MWVASIMTNREVSAFEMTVVFYFLLSFPIVILQYSGLKLDNRFIKDPPGSARGFRLLEILAALIEAERVLFVAEFRLQTPY